MIENHMLSAEQITAMLDNAPVAVFVASVDTLEIYYANHMAKEMLILNAPGEAVRCYHVAGFGQSCPFCHADEMNRTELFVREFHRLTDGHIYQLSGKIIDWNGKPAHIEYILDITERKKEDEHNRKLKDDLERIFSSVPCGLCVYHAKDGKVSPLFHNSVFYKIMGYSKEHIHRIEGQTDYLGVHPEDMEVLQEKINGIIRDNGVMQHTYRVWNDEKNAYQWTRLDGTVKLQKDGSKLLYAVYSDMDKERQLKKELIDTGERMRNIVNSIPGGIVSYRVEGETLIPTFSSDGVMAISGHTREEYMEITANDVFDIVHEPDRSRVYDEVQAAMKSGELLDLSYRMRHKNGSLIWVHFNGRRAGSLSGLPKFYAVLTGMSEESRMYQDIANETSDCVYVIDKGSYELLYANEAKDLFSNVKGCIGEKCYTALHGKDAPCTFCTLLNHVPDGKEHEMEVEGSDRLYATRFRETIWNGVPAYVKYIRDVTEEINTRREKERLELYFQTIVKNLVGGVAVVHCQSGGSRIPEFLSDGFAEMLGMTQEEAMELYRDDAMVGVYPEDIEYVQEHLDAYIASGDDHCEMVYRLNKKAGGYIWVKVSFTMMQNHGGESSVYGFYHDITKEREEQERIRQQYNDMIVQHYSSQNINTLVVGHCNITKNRILEIKDYTDSNLLMTFGYARDQFFYGLASLLVVPEEREKFSQQFQNEPARIAYKRNETEQTLTCFAKLPKEENGRFVKFLMNLVEAPDTGDITGILTVTDVTEQTISDGILHQLSVTSYEYVVDLNIQQGTYTVLAYNKNARFVPKPHGMLTQRVVDMVESTIVPKDRELYRKALEPAEIRRRLEEEGTYTISYSLTDEQGEIRTRNMTISAVDMRLNRVCLVCTDITESVWALENALTLAEKANRAKSDFLSAMSHDIRTPMNAIMGMTDIAAAHAEDPVRVKDCLGKISISGRHLLSLINDILDMSQIESSRMVMNRMDTSLADLMQQISAIIGPQAKAAGLHFILRYQEVCHAYFYGDSLRVNQILINLLSNAVKFTPKGEVKLVVQEICPLKDKVHIRYRFTVSDTGIGMQADFLKHVFDPFLRSSSVSRIEGTGLGLSITKGLVEHMGGEISVESKEGEGTSFSVELEFEPAKNEEAARTEEAWAESIESSKEKVFSGRRFLVVEDNALNAEIICELLQMQDAELVVKTDGRQALEAFHESEPGTYDAILMDIQMPEMNGHDATRAIRGLERPDAKSIPIIAMTANAFQEDVQKSQDAGMSAHVAKPIDINVLRAALDKILDHGKQE